MHSEMNRSGRIEKFLDLTKSPGCKTIYMQPLHPKEGRPAFKNDENPFQHDRSYLNRMDIHRGHVEKQAATRREQSFQERMRSTWSGFDQPGPDVGEAMPGSEHCDAIIGFIPRFNNTQLDRSFACTRSMSSPSLTSKPFMHLKSHPHSPSEAVLIARKNAGKIGHMPGYRGFIPGLQSENHNIGHGFTKATEKIIGVRRLERTGSLEGKDMMRQTWGVTPFNQEFM